MESAATAQLILGSGEFAVPFDSIPEPYLGLYPNDGLAFANTAAMNLFECERAIPISELERLLSISIRSLAEDAIQSETSRTVDKFSFVDSDNYCHSISIKIIPSKDSSNQKKHFCVAQVLDITEVNEIQNRLTLVENELSIVSQVSSQLGSIMDSEEIHKIILIAVTAREGLGFNRAFLFLCNDNCEELKGSHALGPRDADEAGRIWNSIPDDGADLRTVIRRYRRTISFEDSTLDDQVKGVSISLHDQKLQINDAVESGASIRIIERDTLDYLVNATGGLFGGREIAVAPLVTQKNILGVIVADNLITGRSITRQDIDQLHMFASQGAMALERARLYERLESNLDELELTNKKLEKTQREIVRIERLSLMGELSYRIAHELRNPLTIIGGFASLLSKAKGMQSTEQDRAQIIMKECRRIEKQLDELLDYSRSFSQEEEEVDLNEIVIGSLDMVYPRLADSVFILDQTVNRDDCRILAHKDQLLHGIYNIFMILDELSADILKWRISIYAKDDRVVIDLAPDKSYVSRDESIDIVRNFVRGRVGKSGLKLSLASETIRYNGGEVGFSVDQNNPRVYLSFDKG